MYQVPGTKYEVWNLSQVRQGLGGRYWKGDRLRIRVPCTKSLACRRYFVHGTWYLVHLRYEFHSESILVLRLPAGGTWYLVQIWNYPSFN